MNDYFSDENTAAFVQDRIESAVGDIHREAGRWVFRCPICGDSRKRTSLKRGFYYTATNSFHCFNEGCHCSGLWIVVKFTATSLDQVKKDYVEYQKRYGYDKSLFTTPTPRSQPVAAEPEPPKERKVIAIPDSWMPVTELCMPKLHEYLVKRKVYEAPYLPKNYEFYYDNYSKRLVLPWHYNGEMIYYQLRAVSSKQSPKYLFPKSEKAHKVIFNLDKVDITFPYIFLLEGALDAIFVKNGVAVGGLNFTEYQQTLMAGYSMCEPVYMLDNQHLDHSAKNKLERIIKKNDKQKVFLWPKSFKQKDVNDHYLVTGENPFLNENFLKERVTSGLKALLELRGSL